MTLRQSYFVPPAPFVIAEDRGLLAAAGLDIESRRTRSSGEQLDGLVSGDIDVAITAMDNVFIWNQRGADVRVVAQIEATTLLTVYGRPGIRTLADLDRGRFAVDAMANGFSLVARWLLEEAGIAVSFIEVGGVKERLDALVAGAADGTLLGPPLDELAERAGLIALASANAALPALAGQGVVVRAQRSEAQTAQIREYLRVLERAIVEADRLGDDEGIALFERNGFPGRSASDAWRTRPRSVLVDADGIALLESLRAGFGLLPDGYAGLDTIIDGSLTASLHHAS